MSKKKRRKNRRRTNSNVPAEGRLREIAEVVDWQYSSVADERRIFAGLRGQRGRNRTCGVGFHDSRFHHRTRPDSKVIRYRVVDEYDSKYIQEKETSQQPLTLDELVTLMDTVERIEFESWGLVDHQWDYLAGEGSYDQKADEWIAERRAWETEDLDAALGECSREI